jgi:RimJ/RimL family protein N-acetyltransferase
MRWFRNQLTRLRGVSATVILEPWGSGDLPLLERLMGDPRMTEYLGGPESPDKLRERQDRYERLAGGDRMFKVIDVASGAGVGSVGFWTKEWRGEQVYEVGWMVVPEFQGRGIAMAAAAQAIELAKREDKHRFVHTFPNVDNAPSNAICRKLGFELLEACEFEFPKGQFMTCNEWRLDLRSASEPVTRINPTLEAGVVWPASPRGFSSLINRGPMHDCANAWACLILTIV